MIKTICPHYIGSTKSFYETASLIADEGTFKGYYSFEIKPDISRGVDATRDFFKTYKLIPVGFRVPINISDDEVDFELSLSEIEESIKLAAEIGYRNALTWTMPGSNRLNNQDYFEFLRKRLKIICETLRKYNLTLGVELVAPYTLQVQYKYPFSCRLEMLLELINSVESDNIGIILDAFHFYCAGHSVEDYALISDVQVVMAHISDAVKERSVNEQLDLDRRMPGETDTIDLSPFFQTLSRIGFEGAVIPEPLCPKFDDMEFTEALSLTADALNRIWPTLTNL